MAKDKVKGPVCCNEPSKWVENIRDKGYWYCSVCRNEVKVKTEAPKTPVHVVNEDWPLGTFSYYVPDTGNKNPYWIRKKGDPC